MGFTRVFDHIHIKFVVWIASNPKAGKFKTKYYVTLHFRKKFGSEILFYFEIAKI